MKPHVIGCIFARGGSKGVPRKNIRPLAGKPLIAYAIQTALESKWIDRVIVSTDDREIADVARQYGAEVPFLRPVELAQDDSPEWAAWQHALRTLTEGNDTKIDAMVSVPPTAPLRLVEDVDACVSTLLNSNADVVITVRPAERNPYFNMVTLDDEGYAHLVIPLDRAVHRRQSAPCVYDMTTVAYAMRPEFILNASAIFQGRVKTVTVPSERAIDIDTDMDFKIAEFLVGQLAQKSKLNEIT